MFVLLFFFDNKQEFYCNSRDDYIKRETKPNHSEWAINWDLNPMEPKQNNYNYNPNKRLGQKTKAIQTKQETLCPIKNTGSFSP